MRIVFLGSGEFAVPTLRWLADNEFDVPLVITQPARGAGRGRKQTQTAVSSQAKSIGWEVWEVPDVNESAVAKRLRSLDATLGLVIAFGQKLGSELLGAFPGGCINLHASLLPKYRGAAPINWAVVNGEERTGCTVFRIVERMDAGPILCDRWTYIKPEETAGELHDRLARVGVDAVEAALTQCEGDEFPQGTPQDDGAATAAPKLTKRHGYVDFAKPAREVTNHVLGMTPWPGASAKYAAADGKWESVQIVRARLAEDSAPPDVDPGTIDQRRFVAARDAYVEILEIKPSSGRVMTWPEYVNGRHVAEGDRFISADA